MKILHRYIAELLIKNFAFSLSAFVFLFLIFDFFDRIDNVLTDGATVFLVIEYFLFKIPLMLSLMFPVAMMVSILFTLGLLSKSSEVTAMRASGVTVFSLATPVFVFGLVVSLSALVMNETLVPYAQRRSKEIYNIDIRQKDKNGSYSQSDFWWRGGSRFFSVSMFDSRSNELSGFSAFDISPDFEVARRTDAEKVRWVNPELGWNMLGVSEYRFSAGKPENIQAFRSLPLPIRETPLDFYEVKTDPTTMTIAQLRKFIKQQAHTGIEVASYYPYLYEKFSFPLFNLVVCLIVLPFSLRPARSGSMATSVMAGLVIGFSYYAVHSFSMAMGKAEIMPAPLSAWLANILMSFIGGVLLLGAESPA